MTQEEALAILKTGGNVFLTGEPGSGKTHTINQYVAYLRSWGIEPAITASTGIAATHIGGFTIHSWSGIGIRRELTKYDLDGIWQNRNVVRRVSSASILIIDEVSMLSDRVLSMVDSVCREIRRSQKPFGGLQVILVGDFFQLPPVSRRGADENSQKLLESNMGAKQEQFAFTSSSWSALNPLICYLSEQHRQEDKIFLEFLTAIRTGNVQESHKIILRKRYSKNPKDDITQLYAHNADVDAINVTELAKLSGETKIFEMKSRGPEKLVTSLKRGCLSSEILSLKVGARVMFTKNDIAKRRYANGTLGTITGFLKGDGNYPLVKTRSGKTVAAEPDEWHIEDGGRVLARIVQVPLRLAWAMTVHKSQGMSLDAAHMDLSQVFEYGQGYVALSRLRTLSGLSISGLNARALEIHPEISLKDAEFRAWSEKTRLKFSEIDSKELQTLHANFIQACGGLSVAAGTSKQAGKFGIEKSRETAKKKSGETYDVTLALLRKKKTLSDIAKERGITLGTVISHLEKLKDDGKIDSERDLAHIKRNQERFEEMKKTLEEVFEKEGKMLLSPARALLDESFSYQELRLARLFLK